MPKFYYYDGSRWDEVSAVDMNVAEMKVALYSWLITDTDQKKLGVQAIDDDEYAMIQCQIICQCKLERGKAYTVALGDKMIKCEGLTFSNSGLDKSGYQYNGFTKNEHPVWVFSGAPKLLLAPQPPS